MEKSINLVIVETKQQLINVLNQSGLPIGVCSMLLHELSGNVDDQYNQMLTSELAAQKPESGSNTDTNIIEETNHESPQ